MEISDNYLVRRTPRAPLRQHHLDLEETCAGSWLDITIRRRDTAENPCPYHGEHSLELERAIIHAGHWLCSARLSAFSVKAKARMLKMENGHLEFVFNDPVARGNYLISVYTRGGKTTDYKTTRICRQVKAI